VGSCAFLPRILTHCRPEPVYARRISLVQAISIASV
jgi:hypothetical protein